MSTLISEHPPFIFVHIIKTGGTSISDALLQSLPKPARSLHHETLSEVRQLVSEPHFRQALKFCFVRNPWDWMVSLYSYVSSYPGHPNHQIAQELSFEEFLPFQFDYWRNRNGKVRTQRSWICDDQGQIEMDVIGRFESIEQDFADIAGRLDLRPEIPHLNSSDRRPYQDYYNRSTRELVTRVLQEDIELFGYEF